ncbi:MAG TPA: single-stranded-DNA-specific exonuclease RecJ [Methylophaga aminisulfidivorans]|nr:single-stranded-DNA-specific exonuclease RecJ [Methylophaga aminisulfidivorans]
MAFLAMNIVERATDGWQQLPNSWPALVRKVLSARGIKTKEDMFFQLKELPRPEQLSSMSAAVSLLEEALQNQWKVTIVADFDSDGATSCALAIRGLKAMGLQNIDFIVPNRFIHGYGLTPRLLADLDKDNLPDLLITVDNGISAHAGVDMAHQLGMKVLVTDHHLAGDNLPQAEAIVNPNQPDDLFPYKNLAGVGVCFYLLIGLRQHLRQLNWFEQHDQIEPKVIDWLDLVALGTVADVVPLDKLNRSLVNIGLQRIRQGKGCEGINALISVAGREAASLLSSDLAFSIAPRLNAAGRMEDMGLGIQLLTDDSAATATQTARMLNDINIDRRTVEQTMQDDAKRMLAELSLDGELPRGLCLYHPEWHQGVIGLLASRVKEKVYRPVVAFAQGDEGELKGSARSIPGIHIRDVLARVASHHPDILERFGGHAMAAGLTIKYDDLAVFENAFHDALEDMISADTFLEELASDGQLEETELQLINAEALNAAVPWGQGFEEPRFHGTFIVQQWRLLGQEQNHLRLQLHTQSGEEVTAIAFGQTKPDWLAEDIAIIIRYKLSVNEFRGQRTLQLLIDQLAAA